MSAEQNGVIADGSQNIFTAVDSAATLERIPSSNMLTLDAGKVSVVSGASIRTQHGVVKNTSVETSIAVNYDGTVSGSGSFTYDIALDKDDTATINGMTYTARKGTTLLSANQAGNVTLKSGNADIGASAL